MTDLQNEAIWAATEILKLRAERDRLRAELAMSLQERNTLAVERDAAVAENTRLKAVVAMYESDEDERDRA